MANTLLSSVQRACTMSFVMFLTFGFSPALIATCTSLGFDAVNDQNLCDAWIGLGALALSRLNAPKPSGRKAGSSAPLNLYATSTKEMPVPMKREMPVPTTREMPAPNIVRKVE